MRTESIERGGKKIYLICEMTYILVSESGLDWSAACPQIGALKFSGYLHGGLVFSL